MSISDTSSKIVVLLGNPNVGKTTLFNGLTGLQQRTGNFSGVTVEKKIGSLFLEEGIKVDLVDLPGTYSLAATSPDEIIAVDVLLGQKQETLPHAVIAVIDATNLERNLYLITQILECKLPTVLALNMSDLAQKRGIEIHAQKLSEKLGTPVIPIVANKAEGLDDLRKATQKAIKKEISAPTVQINMGEKVEKAIEQLLEFGKKHNHKLHRVEALRVLLDEDSEARRRLTKTLGNEFDEFYKQLPITTEEDLVLIEPEARYDAIGEIVEECVEYKSEEKKKGPTLTDRLDQILTHPIIGSVCFVLLMALVFQAIYSWSGPLMDSVDGIFGWLSQTVGGLIPEGALQSLVTDGVIAGVGSVVIFLPQILILFTFIAILEDCGYMARAAFLMDRIMRWAGLSGHSFVPMLSSFACAIPGVMATRVIENRRDRYATMMVAPLMSCSARLPVYTIMIAAFIPATTYFGIGLQGLVLFSMYVLGVIIAIPVAWILKKTILKGSTPPFVMEMPAYKLPALRTVFMRVYQSGKAFLVRAGTIIFAATIVIWGLAYFPRSKSIETQYASQAKVIEKNFKTKAEVLTAKIKLTPENFLKHSEIAPIYKNLSAILAMEISKEEQQKKLQKIQKRHPGFFTTVFSFYKLEQEKNNALSNNEKQQSGAYLRNSFMGKMGKIIEPIVKPLGWDWKIGIATIAAFPAREVIVATMGIIYNLGADEDEESEGLLTALQKDTWPDGRPIFTPLVALTIMVFFALCAQCVSTLAIIWRETGTWRWAAFSFGYMTVLAYVGALITFQVGSLLGF